MSSRTLAFTLPLRRFLRASVWFIAGALVLGACRGDAPGRVEEAQARAPRVRSETIGHLGSRYRPGSLTVSWDHRHLAWVDDRGDRCRIVVDRKKGPFFAHCDAPRFSPDGATVLYWAAAGRDDPPRIQLVANGRSVPVVVAGGGPVHFSREGGIWAAAAPAHGASPSERTESAPGAVDDTDHRDDAGEPADESDGESSERRVIAFHAAGVLGEHADTTAPVVSPDGTHVAYIAADQDGRQALMVDGEVERRFAQPGVKYVPAVKPAKEKPNLEPETALHYLSDGSLVGVALAEAGWTVFHDDSTWASYPAIRQPVATGFQVEDPSMLASAALLAGSLSIADDAPTACWWERIAGEAERWRVTCNGKPVDLQTCESFRSDPPITVAADGRSAAYLCQDTAGTAIDDSETLPRNLWVVVNGHKLGPHRFVWGIELSRNGEHYAYAAADRSDEPWFYIVDGKRYDGPWQRAFPAKLSPDGSSMVWAASQEETGPRVDLVFDGDVLTRAEMVMAPPLFRDDGTVQWAVKRGKSVRRLIVAAKPTAAPSPG